MFTHAESTISSSILMLALNFRNICMDTKNMPKITCNRKQYCWLLSSKSIACKVHAPNEKYIILKIHNTKVPSFSVSDYWICSWPCVCCFENMYGFAHWQCTMWPMFNVFSLCMRHFSSSFHFSVVKMYVIFLYFWLTVIAFQHHYTSCGTTYL